MTNVLGGVANVVSSTAQTAAQIAGPSVSQMTDPFSSIEQSLRNAIPGNDPAALRDAALAATRAAVTGDQLQAAESARARSPGDSACAEYLSEELADRSSNTNNNIGR